MASVNGLRWTSAADVFSYGDGILSLHLTGEPPLPPHPARTSSAASELEIKVRERVLRKVDGELMRLIIDADILAEYSQL